MGGTFETAECGTFETDMPGTFHSATGGTFVPVMGGTFNPLLSDNNAAVRKMLLERGIVPENLPAGEDIKKVERRLASEEKKIVPKKN